MPTAANQPAYLTRAASLWRRLGFFRLVLMGVAAGILILWVTTRIFPAIDTVNSDFMTIWLGGRFQLEGLNPYDESLWLPRRAGYGATYLPDRAFIYPLPLSILAAPLALFSLDQAFFLMIMIAQAMMLGTLALAFRIHTPKPALAYLLPLLAATILYRPLIATIFMGHLGTLLMFLTALTALFWDKGRWILGGLALAFLAVKPNTGIFIIAALGLWALINTKWKALAGMAAGGIFLLVLGLVRDPAWVQRYQMVGNRKLGETFGGAPTVWGFANELCDLRTACTARLGVVFAILLVLVVVGVFIAKRGRLPASSAVSLATALAITITPYIWVYDQVFLLLPVYLVVLEMAKKKYPYLLIVTLPLGLSILAIALLSVAVGIASDVWSVFNALPVLLLAGWWALVREKPARRSEIPALPQPVN